MQRNRENNRMGKSRNLFKEIGDIKGTFHARMGTIKDRNDKDIVKAKEIKKRWQEYTEELYKKDLHNPDNQNVVIVSLGQQRDSAIFIRVSKLVEVMEFQLSYFKS